MPSIRDIILGKTRYRKQAKRAMVCVDFANWRPYLYEQGIQIDWDAFRTFLESIYASVSLFYYDGIPSAKSYAHNNPTTTKRNFQDSKTGKERFFKKLEELGYTVRHKTVSDIYVGPGMLEFKCNFDVEITLDVMERLDEFDVLVLCSGDGDFIALLKKLKSLLRETHVIAVKGRCNRKLRKTANHFDYLDKLLVWVQSIKKP